MLIIRELLHWVNHYCYMFFHVDTNPTQYNNFIQTHTFTFANIVYNSLAQIGFEERMDEIRNHGHDCVQRAGELLWPAFGGCVIASLTPHCDVSTWPH